LAQLLQIKEFLYSSRQIFMISETSSSDLTPLPLVEIIPPATGISLTLEASPPAALHEVLPEANAGIVVISNGQRVSVDGSSALKFGHPALTPAEGEPAKVSHATSATDKLPLPELITKGSDVASGPMSQPDGAQQVGVDPAADDATVTSANADAYAEPPAPSEKAVAVDRVAAGEDGLGDFALGAFGVLVVGAALVNAGDNHDSETSGSKLTATANKSTPATAVAMKATHLSAQDTTDHHVAAQDANGFVDSQSAAKEPEGSPANSEVQQHVVMPAQDHVLSSEFDFEDTPPHGPLAPLAEHPATSAFSPMLDLLHVALATPVTSTAQGSAGTGSVAPVSHVLHGLLG